MMLALGAGLAGCTYQAQVLETPSFNVVSSYGEQIPGKWFLYVDATPLKRPIKPSTYACSLHSYPIDAAGPFATSVRQTLDNVVDQLEVLSLPISASSLKARGARGLIVVRGEEVRARMESKAGFWSATMEGQATVIASITVDGPQGRLLGTTVEGIGNATEDAGVACEGGAKALGEAVSQGMGDTMRRLGEAVSNSPRVRGS